MSRQNIADGMIAAGSVAHTAASAIGGEKKAPRCAKNGAPVRFLGGAVSNQGGRIIIALLAKRRRLEPEDPTLKVIERANEIIAEYGAGGFFLRLRQLNHQFVARRLIENTVSEYKRLVASDKMAAVEARSLTN